MLRKLIFFSLFLFSAPVIYACSCAPTPTVNYEYETSKVVMTAQVESIRMGKTKYAYEGAYLIVKKAYKGALKPGDRLFFANFGTSCDIGFDSGDIGRDYIFYTFMPDGGKSGKWAYGMCGRDGPVADRADDLLYLDNMKAVTGRSRLAGSIIYSSSVLAPPLSGRKVIIEGNGITQEAVTGTSGEFEVYDLPGGAYTITTDPEAGWGGWATSHTDYGVKDLIWAERSKPGFKELVSKVKDNNRGRTVAYLPANRHLSINFKFRPTASISGKVTGMDGEPIRRLEFSLLKADQMTPLDDRGARNWTDYSGEYKFYVLPGKYYVVINPEGTVSSRYPFGRIYYPGVTDIKDAVPIEVKEREEKVVSDIKITNYEKLIWLSGKMLSPKGTPLTGGDILIRFIPDKPDSLVESEAMLEQDGTFRVPVLPGRSGKLVPESLINLGMIDEEMPGICSSARNYLRKIRKKGKPLEIPFKPVFVKGGKDVSGIIFRLPFEPCDN